MIPTSFAYHSCSNRHQNVHRWDWSKWSCCTEQSIISHLKGPFKVKEKVTKSQRSQWAIRTTIMYESQPALIGDQRRSTLSNQRALWWQYTWVSKIVGIWARRSMEHDGNRLLGHVYQIGLTYLNWRIPRCHAREHSSQHNKAFQVLP